MILSANQPYFSPYPGFFYKARLADTLVLLDTVQFPRGFTWLTRNRFKNHLGTLWMSIPVWRKGLGFQGIDSVRIYWEGRWRRKYLASLETAYGNAPYYRDHQTFLERIFSGEFEKLIDLNLTIIRYLLEYFHCTTELVLLSELGIDAKGDSLLIQICKKMGASRFMAQSASKKYLDVETIRDAGIHLDFIPPPTPVYPQLWGDFIPNLSALDLALNCGP
ncbi:MAG: WbqC family protein, partial [Deltaproteobacteria bacterium]|nr:WbqC family protein [Deltaproteobacteria bacterium]